MGSVVSLTYCVTSRTALDEAARRLSATVKTRQQLEAERDAMVKQTVER